MTTKTTSALLLLFFTISLHGKIVNFEPYSRNENPCVTKTISTHNTNQYQSDTQHSLFSLTCETIPPNLSLDTLFPNPCMQVPLNGAYTNATSFSSTRRFDATDNVQIDSLRLIEIIGGVVRKTSMPLIGSDKYLATFTNYFPLDTISYRIEAYDTCGNLATYPQNGYYTFYFDESFPKCAGGNCNVAHNTIRTFPWTQDFEDSNWVASNAISGSIRGDFPDDLSYDLIPIETQPYGWSIRMGSPAPLYTGPSSDHTSGNGKYLYSNFNGQTNQSSTVFVLPCINLEDSVARYFSFFYHMFGSDIKRLIVQIDSTTSATENWHLVWDKFYQQQANANAPWKQAAIDLSPYQGRTIKLRVISIINPNNQNRGSTAIDDLLIDHIIATDVGANGIISPSLTDLACNGTSGISVEATFTNLGLLTTGKVPVAYQLDNSPIVYDTINFSGIPFGMDTNFVFSTSLNLNPSISHNLKIWSELNGDMELGNDTLSLNIPVQQYQSINTFPHFLDFENAPASIGVPASVNSPHWDLNAGVQPNVFWEIAKGPFINSPNGPLNVLGKNDQCLVFRGKSSFSNIFYAEIQSQCIDLSSLLNPVLQFQYHSNMRNIEVEAREFGDPSWSSLTQILSPNVPKTNTTGATYNLSSYAGKVVELRIKVQNHNNNNQITVLDNILIREQPAVDLELTKTSAPTLEAGTNTLSAIKIFLTNWSQTTNGNISGTLNLRLEKKCDTSSTIILGQSSTFNSIPTGLNVNMIINNISFNTSVPAGRYDAKIWIEATNDAFPANDTVYTEIVSLEPVSLPYVNDFENCFNDVSIYGRAGLWQIATPSKTVINQAYEGRQCIVTNADSITPNYTGDFDYFELSPFYGLDTLYGTQLSFWQNFDFPFNRGFGVVQIYDGQNWRNITNGKAYGVNWKKYIGATSNSQYANGFINSSNGWIHSSYPLDEYRGPGKKIIRFITQSHDVDGWAIDSISINFPEQNSASPQQLTMGNKPVSVGANTAQIQIKNTASAPLKQVEVSIESNGNLILNEVINFPSAIPSGKSATVALSQPLILNQNMTSLLIYTNSPNSRKDEIGNDDTLHAPIHILAEADSLPVCYDFEQNVDFSPINALGLVNTGWEKGSPSKTFINGAHQGTSAWYTSNNEYDELLQSYLYTPELPIIGGECYRFGFWHQFDTEENFDGGMIEFTIDSGSTWYTLGKYWSTDTSWYNTQYVQSLDGFKPGWTGRSDDWIYSKQEFNAFADGHIQFRFRFASNASISGEGWAIDDVCFETIQGKCQTISLDKMTHIADAISIYPVPTKETLNIVTPFDETMPVSIFDAKAGIVRSWTQNFEKGKAATITIAELPPGIYWINIQHPDKPITRKFIKL